MNITFVKILYFTRFKQSNIKLIIILTDEYYNILMINTVLKYCIKINNNNNICFDFTQYNFIL